jgi:hypothetical protein
MPRVLLEFQYLSLFEDEDAGSVHMAMYATVRDSANAIIASFRWNNRGMEVDETRTYSLSNDAGNVNAVYFDLNTFATITVEAFTHDDSAWPDAGNFENALGSASIVFDPRDPATLGNLSIGPTRTDDDATGYLVNAMARVVPASVAGDVRIKFENLLLFEDEEGGSTHMAIYVFAKGPGIDREIFRWNNNGDEVDEVFGFGLDNSPSPKEQTITLTGPTAIYVESYVDDDEDWPRAGASENFLGAGMVVVDPGDPGTAGRRQIGPTTTDNDNTGYAINVSLEILPANADPDLSIDRIEITQAIQHSQSSLGNDNSVPMVSNKLTLVRAYIDSGVEKAINQGKVAGVTGTLIVTGDDNFTVSPIAPFTAQPLDTVDPKIISDTLNFLIPADKAKGTLRLTVQASVGSNVSNPEAAVVKFTAVDQLNILMVRVRTRTASAPTQGTYFSNMNQLPLIYPIPTDPAVAIRYWILPGSEEVFADHDLTNDDGMGDFLDDLEDIQEDTADFKKLYGMVSAMAQGGMKRTGTSREGDNVAFGLPFLMSAVGHEMGHVYGLEHAPCGTPGNMPDDPDDEFVPGDGSIGDVGVDTSALVAFPANVGDFMGYCSSVGSLPYEGNWISAYHWTKLFEKFQDL